MGVEIQNNFVDGLYYLNAESTSNFQINGNESDYRSFGISKIKNVKQCLKSKVVGNLKNRGIDHAVADFSPKPNFPMTEEEIEKDERRRQSNRDSARKCREKQKQEDSNNRKLLKQLKEDKEKLLESVKRSEEEKNKLLFNLKSLLPDSYITEALKKVPDVTKGKGAPIADRYSSSTAGDYSSTDDQFFSSSDQYSSTSRSDQYSSTTEIALMDDTDFSGKYILEENNSDGSYVLTALDNVTGEEETITGFVDYLEVASEETVQVIDFNFNEQLNGQSIVFENQCVSDTLL